MTSRNVRPERRSAVLRNVRRVLVAAIFITSIGITPAWSQNWQPSEPSLKERDWLQLTSGEWVWGEIQVLRDKDLEFDSEELDLLKLDWDDVAGFRSARILTYRFENLGVFTGTATMRDGVVTITTVDEVKEFPREPLIMILEGRPTEINYWSLKATLGLVARSGNTDQADVNTSVRIRRQTPRARLDISYLGNFGEVQGVRNINNHNVTSTWDMLVKAGFFITPAAVNLYHDPFSNIDLKTTVSAGAGYFISRGGDVEWSVGLLAGYVHTEYVSVQEGKDDNEGSFSLTPSTKLDWDITGDIEFELDYNVQVSVPETNNAFHHAVGTLSLDVWGDILDFDFALAWDRVETPQPAADGYVPVRDDFRTTYGLGVDF